MGWVQKGHSVIALQQKQAEKAGHESDRCDCLLIGSTVSTADSVVSRTGYMYDCFNGFPSDGCFCSFSITIELILQFPVVYCSFSVYDHCSHIFVPDYHCTRLAVWPGPLCVRNSTVSP